nr:MAG TPA: hypothetical protein [Caudoviricetes sp.]
MTVYFAGTEPDAFDLAPIDGHVRTAANTSSVNAYDPEYSRCAIAGEKRDVMVVATIKNWGDGIAEGWVQSRLGFTNSGYLITAGYPVVEVRDKDDKILFDVLTKSSDGGFNSVLRYATSDTARVEVNPQAPIHPAPGSAAFRFNTLYFKIAGTTLTLTWYLDGLPVSTVTVTVAYIGGKLAKTFAWAGSGYDSSFYWFYHSEMLVASEDCRGWRVATLGPNSLGTKDEWIGNYADIDEVGAPDDNDVISTDTAAKVELFGLSNLSVSAQNMDVVAVALSVRARRGLTGPQNIKGVVRTNSTEVDTASNMGNVAPIFQPLTQAIWENNPVTGAPFTVSEVQNLELGVKSAT